MAFQTPWDIDFFWNVLKRCLDVHLYVPSILLMPQIRYVMLHMGERNSKWHSLLSVLSANLSSNGMQLTSLAT